MSGLRVAELDACPVCGHPWAEVVLGHRESRLARVWRSEGKGRRIHVAYRCPACGSEWDKEATC